MWLSIITYGLLLVLLIVSTYKQQYTKLSPQVAQGRSSDNDDVGTLIDRIEWTNNVGGRTPFYWRILMVSILCSTMVLMVFTSNGTDGSRSWAFPEALSLLQVTFVLFALLYSAHKYFERHHEIFARIFTQETVGRLRKKIKNGSMRAKSPPLVVAEFPTHDDPFWYVKIK